MHKKLNSSKRFDTLISGDRYLCGVAAAVIGSAVVGGIASNSAASKQAKGANSASQASLTASREANALQESQYNQTRADSAPWVNAGAGALNQLAWKMGITPTNTINPVKTRDQIYADLQQGGNYDEIWGKRRDLVRTDYGRLNAETDRLFAEQAAQAQTQQQAQAGNQADFGSLSRNFTTADLNADPVYQSGLQFGLDQGTQGINRQNAASGSQLSGATLKALARYGNDYGSTKAQGAYERFGTNQATQFNRLSGIAGTGQQQVNQIGSAGQSYANNVGNNLIGTANQIGQNTMGAADARAASYMQTARGINSAVGTGINAYQQNQYLNNMNAGGGTNSLYSGGGYKPDYSFSGARLGN